MYIAKWISCTYTCNPLFFRFFPGSYGEGNDNPLQHSCLANAMDREAWWAAVHGVAGSQTRLSDFTFTFHFHALEKEMATHSSVLAWRIPRMGEPGGLPSMGSHRVGHDWSDLALAAAAGSYVGNEMSPSVMLGGALPWAGWWMYAKDWGSHFKVLMNQRINCVHSFTISSDS